MHTRVVTEIGSKCRLYAIFIFQTDILEQDIDLELTVKEEDIAIFDDKYVDALLKDDEDETTADDLIQVDE